MNNKKRTRKNEEELNQDRNVELLSKGKSLFFKVNTAAKPVVSKRGNLVHGLTRWKEFEFDGRKFVVNMILVEKK